VDEIIKNQTNNQSNYKRQFKRPVLNEEKYPNNRASDQHDGQLEKWKLNGKHKLSLVQLG